jgi:hypothetical protein
MSSMHGIEVGIVIVSRGGSIHDVKLLL